MDEIIQIVLYVGIMVVIAVLQYGKNKTKPVLTSPQPETDEEEAMEEVFPTFAPPAESVHPAPQRKASRTKKKEQTSFKPVASTPVAPKPVQQTPKIRLNTREEAKRAFIYSEIFNRKY